MVIEIQVVTVGSPSLSLCCESIYQPLVQQAFVAEMVDAGKVGWLEEFSSSKDKIGLIAKVIYMLCYSHPGSQLISCVAQLCATKVP